MDGLPLHPTWNTLTQTLPLEARHTNESQKKVHWYFASALLTHLTFAHHFSRRTARHLLIFSFGPFLGTFLVDGPVRREVRCFRRNCPACQPSQAAWVPGRRKASNAPVAWVRRFLDPHREATGQLRYRSPPIQRLGGKQPGTSKKDWPSTVGFGRLSPQACRALIGPCAALHPSAVWAPGPSTSPSPAQSQGSPILLAHTGKHSTTSASERAPQRTLSSSRVVGPLSLALALLTPLLQTLPLFIQPTFSLASPPHLFGLTFSSRAPRSRARHFSPTVPLPLQVPLSSRRISSRPISLCPVSNPS
ncbi:hypothetical protein B0T19DRAFT_224039 [Cercophora scortea]|uniref:Uncharacterized protein n=1 Tax=Cercophora scortea TaxID=314031 RepID=A0AAE0IFH4_9PEZI|nr:hypothetical protein B0T19DRAFT_224039 [Cercophora scortea]